MTVTSMLFFINTYTYAWQENLGIDNNKAAELFQTKLNDPGILRNIFRMEET